MSQYASMKLHEITEPHVIPVVLEIARFPSGEVYIALGSTSLDGIIQNIILSPRQASLTLRFLQDTEEDDD